jgi:hypothetical protein
MIFKDDIVAKINNDFSENADKATAMLKDAFKNAEYLKTDRVIRCIVFLANGDLTALDKYIKMAINDTRDVMLWAEYEKLDKEFSYKRVRDFNYSFEECTKNVKD